MVKPVFFILFIEGLKRLFQVALDEIKECLLVGSSEEKADRVSIGQRTSGRDHQLCNFDQELIVLWAVTFVEVQCLRHLKLY